MSAEQYDVNNIPTFVALPVDTLDNDTFQKQEQFRIIKNAIIKTLSDGSLCIIDANDLNTVQDTAPVQAPVQTSVLPSLEENIKLNQQQKAANPVYKCPKCKESFHKMSLYSKHMMWHRNAKKYKCEKCSAGYNIETNLKIHMAMHGEGKPTCPLCKISFQRLASLKSHLMLHQVEELYTCEECGAEFEKEEELTKHFQSHLTAAPENDSLICSYCNVQFDEHKKYKEHISHHIKVILYILHKLPKSQLGNVSLVSKRFYQLCEDESLWTKMDVSNRTLESGAMGTIMSRQVIILRLTRSRILSPPILPNVKAALPDFHARLMYLDLTMAVAAPQTLATIFRKCKRLRKLSLESVPLNDSVLSALSGNKDIEVLNLAMCTGVTVDGFKYLLTHCRKSVKKMVLSGKKSRKTHGNRVYPHACDVCLKTFSRVSLLERHLRVHSGERPFVCLHCNRGFNQKGTLQIHLSKHTGIKPFQCTLCSAKFNQKGNLRVHVEKTHTAPVPGIKTYKCAHCTCIFKKVASLNVHITKSHANTTNEDMGGISSVMSRLKELEEVQNPHREVVEQSKQGADEPNISYVKLAESFLDGTVRRYLVKQKKVNDVRWYICTYCKKEFKKPSDLIRHTRVHTREKPFMCKQCGASFSLKSTLFCHIKTHIGNHSYVCVICTKKFSSVRSVNLHLRKHSSEKQSQPYKCVMCSKWFNSIQKAKLHSKEIHSDQPETIQPSMKQPLLHTPNGLLPIAPPKENSKPFQCNVCFSKFNKMTNLNRHMLLHNKERKFKCDYCTKAYCTAHALKEHLLVHSGVKNYHCKLCPKKYTTASLLKRHMISHSTHKPYVCPYCDKSFKSVMLCRKHMNIHKREMKIEAETEKKSIDVSNDNLFTTPEKAENISNLDPNKDVANSCVQVAPNSIQIIANNVEEDQIQTIFINCEDLQLGENVYSEVKLPENPDAMFFNSLNELQDANVFSIDPLNNLNQIINNNEQTGTAEDDLTNKILKSNNAPYYPQTELNLLFNLDSEFEANLPNNLSLPDINLSDVPLLSVDAPQNEEKPKFTCDKCSKTFANKTVYTKHVSMHNNNNVKKTKLTIHQCCFCSKSFKKQSDLIRHIRTHTGEKPFACDKCEKKFSLKSTLLSHQRTHNPVSHKRYNCVVCNSFFTSKSSLKVHMTVHTGDKTHSCNFCSMKFRTAAHRKSHETNHHLNPSKKKSKNKVTNLLASLAMDAMPSQKSNEVLGESLENIFVVQEHLQFPEDALNILEENNQNLTNPTIFQSNFLLQENLIPSSLIQLDDGTLLNLKTVENQRNVESDVVAAPNQKVRNLECDICHKKYASKDVLRKHKKIHGANKKFPCNKCDKGFNEEEELEKHEKIHEGFRPYSCMYCASSFTREHNLTTHMKRIHDISLKDSNVLLYESSQD